MLPQRYFDRFYDWIVRPANTIKDIEKVYHFATDAFGNTAFPLDQLKAWHDRYPEGRRLLCDGDLLLGYISLWPIDAQQAHRFCQGTLSEKDLLPMTANQVAQQGAQHWFLSSMIIEPALRRPIKDNPIGMMLAMALNSWAESGRLQYPVTVFTAAYSPEGEALLRRFGFDLTRSADQMVDGDPLYCRSAASKNELFEIFAQRGIPHLFDSGSDT
jgi:hypothetical protein